MASCWGSFLAAASAPGRVCGWAQPWHSLLRLRLSPAVAWGVEWGAGKTLNAEPGSTQRRMGMAVLAGCLSLAVVGPAIRWLGTQPHC